MKKLIIICLITITLLLLMVGLVEAGGIGISPSVVDFKEILTNKVYEKNVRIHNTYDYAINVSLEVEEYNGWLSFPETTEVLPNSYKDVIIKISVPKKSVLGSYETMGYAKALCGEWICVRIGFKIVFVVTNQKIFVGVVDNIRTRDVVQGEPLKFLIGYLNYGNVDNKVLTKIDIKREGIIVNNFNTQFVVNPYSSTTKTLYYNKTSNLGLGQYTADVKVYLKNSGLKLLGERTLYFKVY